MVVLIVSYLFLVFVIPIALSLIVSFRALPVGRQCRHCGGDTIPLQSAVLNAVSLPHSGVVLNRRWCMSCNWEGVTRIREPDVKPPRAAHAPRRSNPSGPGRTTLARPGLARLGGDPGNAIQPGGARTSTQTLDVRSVTVDGRPFRVMLQCWNRTGLYYGRFVFVGPSGRLWLDAIEAFSGANQNEVLGQALSLSDGLLENRLRRLVSDA